MNDKLPAEQGTLLLIIGVLVGLWGVFGLIQARHSGQGGYSLNSEMAVTEVASGGPADAAGLEVGDWIVSVSAASAEGLWKKPYAGGVGVGETQALVVEREGERVSLEILWTEPANGFLRDRIVRDLVTLAFLSFGLWALLSTQTQVGLLLALFGLAYGAANFSGPNLGLPWAAIGFVQNHLSFFVSVLLAHFLMVYPRPKGILRRRLSIWLFYLPFLLFLTLGLMEGFMYPSFRAEHAFWTMVTDLFYMLIALVALILSWVTTSRADLRDSGFYWIPLGLAVAIGPFIVLRLIGMAVPEFSMPGSEFLPLLGVLIPGGLALAVVRGVGQLPPLMR